VLIVIQKWRKLILVILRKCKKTGFINLYQYMSIFAASHSKGMMLETTVLIDTLWIHMFWFLCLTCVLGCGCTVILCGGQN
jgi:hypothetical protein